LTPELQQIFTAEGAEIAEKNEKVKMQKDRLLKQNILAIWLCLISSKKLFSIRHFDRSTGE